ncbi:beta family protein [Massilia solisilvae]|uniref:Beta family protein n=1 Tax=Massilia solisilvae TaxID=1811225 RepID=A0ABT2BPS2_9BURK|nr:beta family protein [Massilia solisilvae]MCS0610050.1 beta family protein [Massilia solisilvae]
MAIKFADYPYYPSLRTRPAEITGYAKLRPEVKRGLVPVMRVGAWPRCDDLSESMHQLVTAAEGNPFILDVTREVMYQNDAVHKLLDPSDDFKAWRDFAYSFDQAIPTVQFSQTARLPQIIRQTRQLEAWERRIAFRVSDFQADTSKVITAMSAMDDPKNALIVIDAGYIRETMAASIAACVSSVNDIRDEIPDAEIAVISTSYPASVTSFLQPPGQATSGVINILERDLFEAIGADAVIYGDHGSIHARAKAATGGKYTPQIDCALYDAWIFERRPNADGEGYIDAARSILTQWNEGRTDDTWGAEMIRKAATGDVEGMKSRAHWIAVRVNLHLTRQFELSQQVAAGEED